MDNDDSKHLIDLAEENIVTSNEYLDARKEYAEAKLYLDTQMALNLPDFRKARSNVGYDMSMIMLLEKSPANITYYDTLIKTKNLYKGLEKVMNAVSSRISLGQSIIKNKIQEGG